MRPWASSSKFDCRFSWFSDMGVYYTIFGGEREGGKRGLHRRGEIWYNIGYEIFDSYVWVPNERPRFGSGRGAFDCRGA